MASRPRPASHVLARVAPPQRRGLVFSLKQSAVPLGGLIAGVLIPAVVEAYGWRAAILTVAVLIAGAAPVIQPLRRRMDDDRDPTHRVTVDATREAVELVIMTPALRPIAMVAFSFGAIQLCLFAFLVTYLVKRADMTLVAAGLAFSTMQLAGVFARVLWGWISDSFASSRVLLALLGVGIIASTSVATTFDESWRSGAILAVCAALGATAVGWNGVYLAEVARVVPLERVGPATGGILMCTFLGVVVGPASFGAIVAATGSFAWAFWSLDSLVLLTVVMLFHAHTRSTRAGIG